jgi:hypothetical protein
VVLDLVIWADRPERSAEDGRTANQGDLLRRIARVGTCRTQRETRPGTKFRCPGCHGMFDFVVHGNGFVELRPAADEPVIESQLPPRRAEQGETQGTRRIFTGRRRNRPIGGYQPFEKSRSYLGALAFFTILGLALVAGSWYMRQIETLGNAKGRQGTNAMNLDLDAKRKAFQEKQKHVLENLKKQSTNVQPSGGQGGRWTAARRSSP